MKAFCSALAAGILVAGGAHAQLVRELPSSYSPSHEPAKTGPFDRSLQPSPRSYGGNETANPNDNVMKGFRTDPRLVGGFELAPNLAVEAGYAHLFDRGFHRIDEGRPEDTSGALGAKSFSIHLAGKYSVPLSERLTAYGKLGVAHSGQKSGRTTVTDTGLYTGLGAQYKLHEKATIGAEVGRHGDAAKKWGSATNSDGVRAKLKMGF
jgi:opacity protein-like surface antigen